jgi:HEAT repeat protein
MPSPGRSSVRGTLAGALAGHVAVSLALLIGVVAPGGCSGDPNDPRTWGKKLGNLREQQEALDRIAQMDVERARVVVPDLLALYQETKGAEHLQALTRYQDPRTTAAFIEALNYSDEEFDKAIIAASVLGEMKAKEAVDKLIEAAEKPLPIKSRANAAKREAMRALIKIGDPQAVPTLVRILGTSADEQDFLLNQLAALGLAEMRDPRAIPAFIKGLFMTGRGTDIFQECRLGLVRLAQASIDPVIELLQGKNAEVKAMAKQYNFDKVTPGVVPFKAIYLLGDLRAEKAVPLLIDRLGKPAEGSEHSAALIALGQIATRDAVDALIAVLGNPKAEPSRRATAADALYMTGDQRAVPVLLEVARSGYITVGGQKASDLRANAAIDFARLAGPDHFAAFKALADKETEVQGVFGEALDRLQVAKECGSDLACYGKALLDPSWPRAEKAAFALGFSGDKAGVPLLLGGLRPLLTLSQDRYPVHQAMLFSLVRLADKTCKDCEEKLIKQIDRDEKAVRLPGARSLLAETRVALAQIQNAEPRAARPATLADRSEPAAAPGKGGKAKANSKAKKRR